MFILQAMYSDIRFAERSTPVGHCTHPARVSHFNGVTEVLLDQHCMSFDDIRARMGTIQWRRLSTVSFTVGFQGTFRWSGS